MRPISQALGRGKSCAVRRKLAAANRQENAQAAPSLPRDIKKKKPEDKKFSGFGFCGILSAILRLFGGIGGNLPNPRGDRLRVLARVRRLRDELENVRARVFCDKLGDFFRIAAPRIVDYQHFSAFLRRSFRTEHPRRQKGGGEHCQKFPTLHLRPICTIFRKSPRSRPP